MRLTRAQKLGIKLILPLIVIISIYIYYTHQIHISVYNNERYNNDRQTIKAKVLKIKETRYNNLIDYDVMLTINNPFVNETQNISTIQRCEVTDIKNYCQNTMGNMTQNDIIMIHITKNPIQNNDPIIDILKCDNIHELDIMTWKYQSNMVILIFVMIYSPFMIYVINNYRGLNNNSEYYTKIIFIWLVCLVGMGYMNTKYNIRHQNWRYIESDMTIGFVIKTNMTHYDNHQIDNLIRYDIFYKPNSIYQKYHGSHVQSSVVYCPNNYFRHHNENNFVKCVQHHDRYYNVSNLVVTYISKVDPFDIKIIKPITFYNKIESIMILMTIIIMVISVIITIVWLINIRNNKKFN